MALQDVSSRVFATYLGYEPLEGFGPMLFNVPLSSREDIVLLAEEVLLARDVPHGGRLRVHVEWPDKVAVDVCRPIEVRQHQPEHQDQLCVRPNGKPETHY